MVSCVVMIPSISSDNEQREKCQNGGIKHNWFSLISYSIIGFTFSGDSSRNNACSGL